MDILFTIIFVLLLYYLVINLAMNRTFSDSAGSQNLSLNNCFSIIIAAKNEMDNIDKLLESLNQLDYPNDYFEIIIIDDNSIDNTFQIMKNYSKAKDNCTIYYNPSNISNKKGALTYGISKAKYDKIIITDADCILPKELLKFYSDAFNKKYQLVFGLAPFIQQKTFVNQLACYENLRSQLLMFASAKLGLPYSATARNLGFTRRAYEQLGGYSNTMETLSGDDDLLLREAVKHKLRIGTIAHQDAAVLSRTKEKWDDYLKQKSRHTSTSHHYLLRHKVFLGLWHISNILLLFSIFLAFFNQVFILPPLIKLVIDSFIVQQHQRWFNYRFNLFTIIPFQVIYEILIVTNFVNSIRKKSDWQ